MSEIELSVARGVARVTLNRPEQLNALSPELIEAFKTALDAVNARDDVHVLVITGAGRAFCAGADLKFAGGAASDGDLAAGTMPFLRTLGDLFNGIEASPLPVVGAINGLCMAGGLELALCCDLILASESAVFSDAHATYGLLPGGGATVRLPRRISMGRAKRMMFTAERIDAGTAADWGLVDQVVANDKLLDAVDALALRMTDKSRLGLAHMKEMLNGAAARGPAAALVHELAVTEAYSQSEDIREGLAAFAARRKPQFKGR